MIGRAVLTAAVTFGLLAAPLVGEGQPVARIVRIGTLSIGTAAARAAKEATAVIPVVVCNVGDPVGTGLVLSGMNFSVSATGRRSTEDATVQTLALFRELCNTSDSLTQNLICPSRIVSS